MHKPYRDPIVTALPDVKVPEPRISKFFVFIARYLSRIYLRAFFGPAKIVYQGDIILLGAFARALKGESRCIVAFRHPNGADPQLLAWSFFYRLKGLAAKYKTRFHIKPHAVFIYGYEVIRWGGALARVFLPNIGAMPIHHSKLDTKGMDRIYKAITDGPYPVALAPEGQVSYTTDSVPRLEDGVIRIGFQAAQRIAKKNEAAPAGRAAPAVEILPVSFHFRYSSRGRKAMEKLLAKTEKVCGISHNGTGKNSVFERIGACRNYILEINEKRYSIKNGTELPFEERLDAVVNAALETAERMLGLESEGDYFTRLYRVRHICWDRIYLPGIPSLKHITPLERSVKDISAGEAWHIARHQELADFGWYFRRPLPDEETAFHNLIEYVQNLWDFANRTMGGAFSGRVNIFPRKVIIRAGNVINLSERLARYREDRKAASAECVSDLEKAYLECVEETNKAEQSGARPDEFRIG